MTVFLDKPMSLKRAAPTPTALFSHTRFIVLAITIVMLLFGSADVILFNMTVICMTRTVFNGTHGEEIEIFSTSEKGFLYSIVAIGCLVSSLTVMKVINCTSGRFTFTLYTMIGGVATILLPLCEKLGFFAVLLARGFQGIGVGMAFAFIGYMAAAWSPVKSNGVFLCALTAYNQLAPLLTMPLAGFSCSSSLGWQGIYYIFGVVTLLVSILFYYIYTDTPRQHRFVNERELALIEDCKSIIVDDEKPRIPYYQMLTDLSVIGTLTVCIGDFICYNIFMLFAPVYLNKVLGLDVKQTGISSAIPYIGSLIMKGFIGPLSDRLTCISMLNNIRIFMCISQLSMTFCLIFLALIPTDWVFIAQCIYLLAIVGSAFNSVGYYKSASLSCGYFSSTVMSWFAIIYALVILILPLGKTYIAGEDSPDQWRLFFYIGAAIALITLGVWLYTAEVKLRPWAVIHQKQPIVSVITVNDRGVVKGSIRLNGDGVF